MTDNRLAPTERRHLRPSTWAVAAFAALAAWSLASAQDGRTRDGVEPRVRPPQQGGWSLGVQTITTETGVKIVQVSRGSAAERAGLERDDLIVTVSGYQVGRVGGREYSLERELERQADGRGRVLLLVHDKRTRSLMNVEVNLSRGDSGNQPGRDKVLVTGRASYRERIAAPPSAVLRVQVISERFMGGPSVIAEREYRNVGNPPYEFEVEVDRRRVEALGRYILRATLSWDGRTQFIESSAPRVTLGDEPAYVELELRRAR